MTIDEILAMDEKQIFERKSIFIKPTDLSDTLCAFANADGGTVVQAPLREWSRRRISVIRISQGIRR